MKAHISRRTFLQGAGVAVLGLGLAACGGGGTPAASSGTNTSASSSSGTTEQPADSASSDSSSATDTPADTSGWVLSLLDDGTVSIEGYNGTFENGAMVIPSTVVRNGNTYTVTKIGVKNSDIFKTNTDIRTVSVPSTVTEIGVYAFRGCVNMTSISLTEGLETIGIGAFENTGLTSLTLPASVKEVGGGLAARSSSLESFAAKGSNTTFNTVEMFESCTNLTQVSFNSDFEEVGWAMFSQCENLKSFTIPKTVTSIGISAFYGCTSLESITIPDGVTRIYESAFSECSSLTSIKIPDSVTQIDQFAFGWCTALASATLPNAMTYIGDGAFCNCTALRQVVLPEGIKYMGQDLFGSCTALETVYIPASVTKMETLFGNCKSLKAINYAGSEIAWNNLVPSLGDVGLKKGMVNFNASRPVSL